MKIWVNILSARDELPESTLPLLAQSEPVEVFSTVDNRVIGHTSRYEVRDSVDLWAELDVEDSASSFKRAAGVIRKGRGWTLAAVMVTDLTHEEMARLNQGI